MNVILLFHFSYGLFFQKLLNYHTYAALPSSTFFYFYLIYYPNDMLTIVLSF